jgi:chromosome segregation ATPase
MQRLILTILACSLALMALPAQSAKRDDGGSQSQKMQYLMRQMALERDALKAERSKLEKQLEEAKTTEARLNKRIDGLEEEMSALKTRLGESYNRIKDANGKLRDTRGELQEMTRNRNLLQSTLNQRDNELGVCMTHNVNLYKTGLEILDLYEKKDGWDAALQHEAITGLKSVEIENIIQEYTFRLEDEQHSPKSPASSQAAEKVSSK